MYRRSTEQRLGYGVLSAYGTTVSTDWQRSVDFAAIDGSHRVHGVLIHEWIETTGGSEKVLDAMADAFPAADIHCLWNDAPGRYPERRVRETWLSRSPLRRNKIAALLFMPWTWRRLSADKPYDWMLVSSHLFAHHALFPKNRAKIRKFVYVHTPARYIWVPELDLRGLHPIARLVSPLLRLLDRHRAKDPETRMAANSDYIRRRILAAWGRDSMVIYPPVDVFRIQSTENWQDQLTPEESVILASIPKPFVLGASRFVNYKRLDLVIEAAAEAGVSAVIAGAGPEEQALRALATRCGADVTFVISPSTELLYSLYQVSSAYIFPPTEDFGIMPVEAMATGTPVVAYSVGGASESVKDGVTGYLVHELTPKAIASAIRKVDLIDRREVRIHARKFSKERFRQEIQSWVDAKSDN